MSEVPIDGAIQGLERGHQQHDHSARRQNGSHRAQSLPIVLDMLQHVQTDAGIRTELGEVGKFSAAGVTR